MNRFMLAVLTLGIATGFLPASLAAPSAPEAVTMVRPSYPPEAQRAGIQGCAILRFDVSASGVPEHIRVASSTPYPEFGDAARKALEQWRFQPSASQDATQAFAFDLPDKPATPGCGEGSAVAAVADNPSLPALPPPPPLQQSRSTSSAAPSMSPAASRTPPATVKLNVTRPPVTATFETAAGSGSTPSGRVTIRFCVNTHGRTERLKVVQSEPPGAFDATALRIMRAAEFKPYAVEGTPAIACGITQTIVFKPAQHGG